MGLEWFEQERVVEHEDKKIKGARSYTERVLNFLNFCALEF